MKFAVAIALAWPTGCESAKVPPAAPTERSAPVSLETTAAAPQQAEVVGARQAEVVREVAVEQVGVPIGTPSRDQMLVAASTVVPARKSAGSTVTLVLRIRILPGWHIYAATNGGDAGESSETQLDLQLPSGIQPVGEWQLPAPSTHAGQFGRRAVYEGDVTFRRQLKISPDQPRGRFDVTSTITCQVCNDSICQRPEPLKSVATIEIAD